MCNLVNQFNESGRLTDYVANLCLNKDYSDVTFCVEGERLPAHRLILASREYFRALLFGEYLEREQKEIQLQTVQVTPFKALLKYIYNDGILLAELEVNEIIDILRLAHMYDFNDLTTAIEVHLEREMSMETVNAILDVSQMLNLDSLCEACLKFLDTNASAFLMHDSFVGLPQDSLCRLLKRDTFAAPEAQIFQAVLTFTKQNHVATTVLDKIVELIRLPLMTLDFLLEVVSPSGLVSQELVINAIRAKNHIDHCNTLESAINVASDKWGAQVIVGDRADQLLNDNTTIYNRFSGYSSHEVNKNDGITVRLGCTSFINHIKLLIWDKNVTISHKYYVEVSVDQIKWDRVVDHTKYLCRSWQYLYFPLKEVRYIRFFGTDLGKTASVFALVSLKAFQIPKIPYICNGFVTPTRNVATNDRGAIVLSGKHTKGLLYSCSRTMDLTDAEANDYTSHPFGNGEIVIQLGQPYYVGSIRLLLWDPKNRSYGFYVQTSVDNNIWTLAVDMRDRDIESSSANDLQFTQRLVLYVKIIGTKCSLEGDEEFRCVRFECPANPALGPAAFERKAPIQNEKSNT